ncbi:UbiH/UbiF/VisC/COQ6 family ubiquinone biosynthesis hydroxylase [Ponticoccus alexandrii]|uniref:2-octaprenyl-6-methoxyphenyl hydroxylase n=1 Tax=Ponticoccus alexandrii TaxID=1943633 RepID=A0ABX7F653_9RHOB|nr:UbiH/UbiF/VisC/COQ6 family ubiquinone biosynthesis hydroxylase [Ponticoccus alexandrii]ETA50998.1 2-octaprenyl-6-methoxyphenyl hydroxylase [Rhodobacteraceae bacterium PD-2]QRF65681.1 2-octaprenyl-6-methoxyphenyl hydroxylase [Ponticoccus alexandrii]
MDNPARRFILRAMEHDLIIVGGGLNGPALALAAARAGLSSVVLDALPATTRSGDAFDGRSYALALASQRMLAGLGLWEGLAGDAQPMREIKVTDGRVGEAEVFLGLHFDSAEIEEGPMGYMVEDRFLRRALLEAMEAEPLVSHRDGARVTAQSTAPEGASVTLEDGTMIMGRLLVGADGRQSGVAQRAGIRRTGWGYGQTALVCAIAHDKPHGGVAHQLFLPPGPLAILPLTGNRSSIVWSETEARAKAINALPDDQYLEVLRPRFGSFLGEIALAGARFTYPLGLTLANHLVAERLALVGDAAHGMHPIAGQGLNAGLRDVAALAHVLSHAQRRGEDIAAPAVLARYERWRRFDTATLAASTDLFNRLFSNDNPLARMGRDLGMAALGALPGLRRGVIREAAGLTGDLPDLMRG